MRDPVRCGSIEPGLAAEVKAGEVPAEQVCRSCDRCPDVRVGQYALWLWDLAQLPDWRIQGMHAAREIGDHELRLIQAVQHGA